MKAIIRLKKIAETLGVFLHYSKLNNTESQGNCGLQTVSLRSIVVKYTQIGAAVAQEVERDGSSTKQRTGSSTTTSVNVE